MSFDVAIMQGTWSGIVKGFYDQGIVIREARAMLDRMPLRRSDLNGPKERGILKGLVECGLARKKLFGPYVRTDAVAAQEGGEDA